MTAVAVSETASEAAALWLELRGPPVPATRRPALSRTPGLGTARQHYFCSRAFHALSALPRASAAFRPAGTP